MKNTKVLATIVVLLLFSATLAVTMQFSNEAKAVTLYHLSMYTDPSAVPISAGTGDYTPGTLVQLNFTDPVIIGSTKYVFTGWDIDNTWFGSTNPLTYVTMNADHNVTAHYSTSYLFTVNYPWNAAWMESFTPYIWQEGSGLVAGTGANGTYSAWIPQNEFVQAGVTSPEAFAPFGVPWIRGTVYEEVEIFTNWTGLGYYLSGPYAWSNAGKINMTIAKSATMAFKTDYYLYVTSNQAPTPAGQAWYDKNTIAGPLVANNIGINWAARYVLDHWEVSGVSQGLGVNNINVTMDKNYTASAFYKRQSFIYLDDNVGNASGIKDSGKWYDDGVVQNFADTQDLPVAANVRYDFRFWDKYGDAWTNTSNPLHVIFDSTWDGYTLMARYQTQYFLVIQSDPLLAGFLYPDSVVTGWYDAGSTINYKAKPIVSTNPTTQYVFLQWKNQYGGVDPNNNGTGPMSQPWILTAYYKLQYLITYTYSPTSISVAGFPGQQWIDNGTDIYYGAPPTDTLGNFAFYYWVINSMTYPQGVNPAHVGIMTGPISGTAYYANQTKIFFAPGLHNETSPAYCHKFNITINAANFDANRLVGGQPMDIYAFDFNVTWDPAYLEVTNVYLNLNDFFAPNAYFIAVNTVNNGAGTYELAATVKGNFTGFSGTKTIVTLTFHVINDLIYPGSFWKLIGFSTLQLQNHLGNFIWPELGWTGTWYNLNTVKPVVEARNAADHSNLVKVDMNVPQQFFNVEVFLHDGVQVEDFDIIMTFDQTQINVVSIAIATYLQPPYTTYYGAYSNTFGWLECKVVQDPSVPEQNGSGLLFTIQFKVVNQLYYKLIGPFVLSSVIAISSAVLSTSSGPQSTGALTVGVINCNYLYNPLPGDLNFDGVVNVLDLQLIADNWGTGNYDLFGDSKCNLNDLVFVALRFGNHL